MSISKGGRGKTAPYVSTHVRVPAPVKHIVETVVQRYKERLESGIIPPAFKDIESCYLTTETQIPSAQDAVNIANDILRGKKSARASMEKLLTSLYATDIKLGE